MSNSDAAAPRVLRYRCTECKTPIVAGEFHACTHCGLCHALLGGGGGRRAHQCEPYYEDDDTKVIAAQIEQRLAKELGQKKSDDMVYH